MKIPAKTLAALLVSAAGISLFTAPASAAPTGQPAALSNVDTSMVGEVQYRRVWRNGRWQRVWVGPARGAYARGPVRRHRADPCGGDPAYNSAYPSWACLTFPRENEMYRRW
jgi:hypothetical protein